MTFFKKSRDEQASYIDSFIRHSYSVLGKLPEDQKCTKELLDATALQQIAITPIEVD